MPRLVFRYGTVAGAPGNQTRRLLRVRRKWGSHENPSPRDSGCRCGPASRFVQIVQDVAASHGHPRALVGATLHAAALHTSLTTGGTLGYGELVQALLDNTGGWADVPDADAMPEGWLESRRSTVTGPFENSWRITVDEARTLLLIAQKGMGSGALASEEDTLRELGCTGGKTIGSGTVTAVGAIYLASRSAANPKSGLLSAAYLPKADTDTLASMTASLLGALAGPDWLGSLVNQVQDTDYLVRLAEATLDSNENRQTPHRITKSTSDRFTRTLEVAKQDQRLHFVDGRSVTLTRREILRSRSNSTRAEVFELKVQDGQTLQVVRNSSTNSFW